jgi:beta-lactamase class D
MMGMFACPAAYFLEILMRFFLTFLFLIASSHSPASEWKNDARLEAIFSSAGAVGTFVWYDVTADSFTVHDRGRAETRFVPASTFKIPNTLIGLAAGSVKSVDDILPYGGKPQ